MGLYLAPTITTDGALSLLKPEGHGPN
jgi:hypothetical protein